MGIVGSLLRMFAVAGCAVCAGAAAQAQGYPAKLITIVVPSTPGGVTDTLGRVIARRLSQAWGQQVIVENKPGANNGIAAEQVAKSAPDGYTLFLSPESTFVINPAVYKKLNYDLDRDFVPITGLVTIYHAFITHPSVAATSMREMIELGTKRPGTLNYATLGIGSTAHVHMELLQSLTGVKFVPVHYRGATPALTDVIAGHVQMMFLSVGSSIQAWKAGQLKMLAVGSTKRLAGVPEVPTFVESGVADFEAKSWFGLMAPAGTPREIVAKIHGEVQQMMREDEFRDKVLLPQFFEPMLGTTEEFAKFLKSDVQRWANFLRAANIRMD